MGKIAGSARNAATSSRPCEILDLCPMAGLLSVGWVQNGGSGCYVSPMLNRNPPIAGVTSSALDLIGHTPLIALDRVHAGPGRILAKAEFMQPGGSVKDRAARAILLAARADGRLTPGAPVVEMTSGNMGAGLAVVCAALGHPLVVTMSAGNSPQRARMLEALGAEVVLVPQVDGAPGQVTGSDVIAATKIAQQIAAERQGFYVDQFNAHEGVQAHGRLPARKSGSRPEARSMHGWLS